MSASSKESLDIKATIEGGFTLKCVCDMIRRSSQLHHTDKFSEHSSFIWSVWPNGWVFLCELTGSGFKCSWSHLNFTWRACFAKGVPWHSGNYSMRIHSETRTWHDKNIQSIRPYKKELRTQLSHLVSLAKCLSVSSPTKCFWVQVELQSLKFHMTHLLFASSSLTFRHL